MTEKASNLESIRHSLAHLLAAAVLKKYPKTKLGIGPVIENGFYYDFLFPQPTSETDLAFFETEMRQLITAKLEFKGEAITPLKAKKVFKDQQFKLDLIKEFAHDKKPLTLYQTGEIFTDLCRGDHVQNTSEINPDGFKLTHLAGAYWRGSEKNPMLTRVYGLAFATKQELDAHLVMLEEAKKRDHRKLGKDLGLFTISDDVGPGLPMFYPKGTILRRLVEEFIIQLQEKRGYEPIWIPHITKGTLYETSGHLKKYDAMYPPIKVPDEADYYLRPMNCPHFMILYKTLPHSYRDLPVRWTATATVYRHEKSGELSGLTRVRSLTQDDCHVFARPDQIETEINTMLDMIAETYKAFELNDFWVSISTRDPADKEKYIGDEKIWDGAETILASLIKKRGWKYEVVSGEAAFYGPKLDFKVKDAIGREWQLSTIQLDMNLPERFDLEYTDTDSSKKRPVVIHRAILGSTERFLGILIEHLGGAFPFWLAPEQVRILPISDKQNDYAESVLKELKSAGIRAVIDSSNNTVGKKIREAEMQKLPYIAVVGGQEETNKTINIRERGKGNLGEISVSDFLKKVQ